MVLTNAYALSMGKQFSINGVNNLRSLSPAKGLLIQKRYTPGKPQSQFQKSDESTGSAIFLSQAFSTPVDQSIRGNSRAEDMPAW